MKEIESDSENRRAGRYVLGATLLLIALLVWLLLNPRRDGALGAARRMVFGKRIAGADGQGEGRSGNRNGTGSETLRDADAEAAVEVRREDQSIGRLPDSLGTRRPGDEVRPGAAGTDDPSDRIGNSREGEVTAAPTAGANRGNSSARNSVDLPSGNESRIGPGAGDEEAGIPLTATNRTQTLLLDDFSERLRQAGARSGDVQVSLEWKNVNDLDLHVIDPAGEEIFYRHRESASGGVLDVDMNVTDLSTRPVENVYWPARGAAKGLYKVDVVHYANHGAPDPTQFTVRVVVKGETAYYRGSVAFKPTVMRARVTVCTFSVR